MPQPIPPQAMSWTPNVLTVRQKHPWCYERVGIVAAAWTNVENALALLLSQALGASEETPTGVGRHQGNFIARAAIEEAETIRIRIRMMEAILGPLLIQTPFESRHTELIEELRKASRKRNEVVHSTWAYSDNFPDVVIRQERNGKLWSWKANDFDEIEVRIRNLEGRINVLMADIHSSTDHTLWINRRNAGLTKSFTEGA